MGRSTAFRQDAAVVHQLFLLNVLLQLFDGVGTYYEIRHPFDEANSLLGCMMAQIGIGAALPFSKTAACAGLVVLRTMPRRTMALLAITAVVATYACL